MPKNRFPRGRCAVRQGLPRVVGVCRRRCFSCRSSLTPRWHSEARKPHPLPSISWWRAPRDNPPWPRDFRRSGASSAVCQSADCAGHNFRGQGSEGRSAPDLHVSAICMGPTRRCRERRIPKAGELLLFLNPVSEYGLTSPVGLEQGRFRVTRDAKGRAFAVNGRANFGLFDQVSSKASARGVIVSRQAEVMMAKPAGPVSLETLEETVAALAGNSQ